MVRVAASLLVLSMGLYLAYKYWSPYPSLIPDQRALRRIDQIARRHGISHEAAYIKWANRRLRWSRYRFLARQV